MVKAIAAFAAALAGLASTAALAQGQDGTIAERNLQIIEQILPGQYDNANQIYFDGRLKLPDRADRARANVRVTRIDGGTDTAFRLVERDPDDLSAKQAWTLVAAPDADSRYVRMKFYGASADDSALVDAAYADGCDLLWQEEAGQFHAQAAADDCKAQTPRDMFLSEDALWLAPAIGATHRKFDRARDFSCYIDVPGVGGGRAIPYKRYEIADMHDRGATRWITLDRSDDDDGLAAQVGLRLMQVRWPMNNLDGIFTRPSMVLYVLQRESEDTDVTETSYAWTLPSAPRIGINLKTLLANCFTISNEDVVPFFKDEPVE